MNRLQSVNDIGIENKPTVIFVGSPFSFSEQLLGMAGHDLTHIGIARLDDLDAVDDRMRQMLSKSVAVVFDQCDGEDLLETLARLADLAPNAGVAMAYRGDAVLPRVLRMMEQDGPLRDLSLLPMRLQIDSWLTVLRLLICGERYLPCAILQPNPQAVPAQSGAACDGPSGKTTPSLTDREYEVLELVSKGLQNKAIAEVLELSIHTVKLHMHNIIAKLGVRNRTEATLWFITDAQPSTLDTSGV